MAQLMKRRRVRLGGETNFAVLLLAVATAAILVGDAWRASGQETLQLTPQQRADYDQYESLQRKAKQLNDQGKWREAIDAVAEAVGYAERVLGKVNLQSLYAWEWAAKIAAEHDANEQAAELWRRVYDLAQPLYAEKPWKIADCKVEFDHFSRMAQLTPEQLKQYDEVNGLWSRMIELWRGGQLNEAFLTGQQVLDRRKQLVGPTDKYAVADLFFLGRIAFDGRAFETAEQIFRDHLEVALKVYGDVHSWTATAYSWLSSAQAELGRQRDARDARLEALAISRQVLDTDDPALGDALAQAAAMLDAMGEQDQAIPLYKEVLAQMERIGTAESVDFAKTLVSCGAAQMSAFQYADARTSLRRAVALLEKLPAEAPDRTMTYLGALSNSGALMLELADFAAAREFLEQALAFGEQQPVDSVADVLPGVLNQLGLLEAEVGNWDAAVARQTRALDMARKRWGDQHPTMLTALHDFGGLLWEIGRPAAARVNFELVLRGRIRVLGEYHPDVARVLGELAFLMAELGDYEQAAKYANASLESAVKGSGKDSAVAAFCFQNAALLMAEIGQDLPKAVELMERSVDVRRKVFGDRSRQTAQALLNLATIYQAAGHIDKAAAAQREALELYLQIYGAHSAATLTSRVNLGALEEYRGNLKAAQEELVEASRIAATRLPPAHPDVAACLFALSIVEARMDRYAESWRLMQDAWARLSTMLDVNLPHMTPKQMIGFVESLRGRLAAVLSLPPDVSGGDGSLACVLQGKSRQFDVLCRMQAVTGAEQDDPELATWISRGRTLRERINELTIQPPHGMSEEEIQDALQTSQIQLSAVETEIGVRLEQRMGPPPRLTRETVAKALPDNSALVEYVCYEPIDLTAKEGPLPRRPTRCEAFVVFADVARPVVRIDLGDAAAIETAVNDFTTHFVEANELLSRGIADEQILEEDYRDIAGRLSRLAFAPVAAALGDVRRVVVAPAGNLHGVPFGALTDKDGRYLVEAGYKFSYVSSGRDLLLPEYPLEKGTAIFAGPNYDLPQSNREILLAAGTPAQRRDATAVVVAATIAPERAAVTRGMRWKELAGAAAEGVAAAETLDTGPFAPVVAHSGDDALEDWFKLTKRVRALVIITHGFFLEPPSESTGGLGADALIAAGRMNASLGLRRLRRAKNPLLRSGLVFSGANASNAMRQDDAASDGSTATRVDDGWLTASEIAGMDLRGVEVAVLSACSTGRSVVEGGDSLAGLRSAFLIAGARTVVASLFEVPDLATADLMAGFYGHLAGGVSPTDALHAAEVAAIEKLRTERGAAHPVNWGSFVVAGHP